MTVSEACEYFKNQNRILNKLQVLEDVGLGYIRLGQAATTLSGGEAQRVKLATELSKRGTGRRLCTFWMNLPPDFILPTWTSFCRCWRDW